MVTHCSLFPRTQSCWYTSPQNTTKQTTTTTTNKKHLNKQTKKDVFKKKHGRILQKAMQSMAECLQEMKRHQALFYLPYSMLSCLFCLLISLPNRTLSPDSRKLLLQASTTSYCKVLSLSSAYQEKIRPIFGLVLRIRSPSLVQSSVTVAVFT